MKRLIALVAAGALAAPAFAQAVDADLKAFANSYVAAFNKGDTTKLAHDFYAIPGVAEADQSKKLADQIADLRKDEFGKMELFGLKTCGASADAGKLQITYVYNYTYGGVMPPGEQTTVFDMKKTGDGWRIVKSEDLKAGQQGCAA